MSTKSRTTATPVAMVQVAFLPAIFVIAQTAMIGALTMATMPIVISSCTWLTSLVIRVIRLDVEK